MNIQGKLHAKMDMIQVSETFTKQDFVLEIKDNPLYPQLVTFQCIKDRCALLTNFKVGDVIDVTFDLKGREYTDKKTGEIRYFNTIEAWRIALVDGSANPVDDGAKAKEPQVFTKQESLATEDDSLPF